MCLRGISVEWGVKSGFRYFNINSWRLEIEFGVWKIRYIVELLAMEKNIVVERTWRLLKRQARDSATTKFKSTPTSPSHVSEFSIYSLLFVSICTCLSCNSSILFTSVWKKRLVRIYTIAPTKFEVAIGRSNCSKVLGMHVFLDRFFHIPHHKLNKIVVIMK